MLAGVNCKQRLARCPECRPLQSGGTASRPITARKFSHGNPDHAKAHQDRPGHGSSRLSTITAPRCSMPSCQHWEAHGKIAALSGGSGKQAAD
jgi:hypothetical protein